MLPGLDVQGIGIIRIKPALRVKERYNNAIRKDHQLKPSGTARKSVSQPTSIMQPTLQAGACRAITKAIELLGQLYPARRCASPSAFESGIFELLGQLYPARLLFLLLKQSMKTRII